MHNCFLLLFSCFINVCPCVSLIKTCLLSPAFKEHEEEEVGQELTLQDTPPCQNACVVVFSCPFPLSAVLLAVRGYVCDDVVGVFLVFPFERGRVFRQARRPVGAAFTML